MMANNPPTPVPNPAIRLNKKTLNIGYVLDLLKKGISLLGLQSPNNKRTPPI